MAKRCPSVKDGSRTMARHIHLDDAVARLQAVVQPVSGRSRSSLMDALDRVLAQDVIAGFAIPQYTNSAMDGYAVDTRALEPESETRLRVALRVTAGDVPGQSVSAGEAARIFTGAVLPDGTDAVVMQEICQRDGQMVVVPPGIVAGDNCRCVGQDVSVGQTVLRAGTRLRPQELALAAAAGKSTLTVYNRLRVAVFSTGNELREPGVDLPPGCIHDANRYGIVSILKWLGCDVFDLGIVLDEADAIRARLRDAAADCDLIVTSGGMSVGEEDHVKDAIRNLGSLDFWRIAIKPGKPLGFGKVGGIPLLGLPGNPVSALVTLMLIGRPLILTLSGVNQTSLLRFKAIAGFDYHSKLGRREFLRGKIFVGADTKIWIDKFRTDSSGVLSSLTETDGLVDIAEEQTTICNGELVDFLPFHGLR